MRFLGLRIPFTERRKALNAVHEDRGGWFPIIREPFSGAWQRNIKIDQNLALTFHAVFSCETLIASDISKLRLKLVQQDSGGLWTETTNPAYSPVLRSPNPFQNRIQFWESWILSKLNNGNTYVLKQRDNRGVVYAMYILDPRRVRPLVADDGSIFYRLAIDPLSGINDEVIVPAREIIHDRMHCIFHPLIGMSPIYASGLAAIQGLNIQTSSARLFENNSAPGGVLTAPGTIAEATAKRLKEDWEQNFSGKNVGRVAVLGDGLKYEKMAMTAVEGQLIEQLKWSAEIVCSTFHVPPYKIGIKDFPARMDLQAMNVEYYSQCLQSLIESAEICLDEGLNTGPGLGVEFDIEGLLRMDSATQIQVEKDAVGAGIKSPNESRRRFELKPVKGGESPYLQQQNFSLEALAKRDALADPFGTAPSPSAPQPQPDQTNTANDNSPEALAAIKQQARWLARDMFAA